MSVSSRWRCDLQYTPTKKNKVLTARLIAPVWSRESAGRWGGGTNMADEAGEVNTAVEDGEAELHQDEPEVSEPDIVGDAGGSHEPEPPEKTPQPPAESSWSAPLLSLARKATETISSGVSYAAAPRNPSQGSAASSPAEREPENDLNSTSKKLPGRL